MDICLDLDTMKNVIKLIVPAITTVLAAFFGAWYAYSSDKEYVAFGFASGLLSISDREDNHTQH